MLELIVFFSFIAIFLLLYSVFKFILGKQKSISRLTKYTIAEEIREEKRKNTRKDFKFGLNIISKGIGSAKFLDGYKKKIQLQLTRAHILLKAEEYITICIMLFSLAGVLVLALTGSTLYAFVVAAIGWIIPSIVVKSKVKRRLKHLNDQLGESVVLISNSLKAGYSFFQAIDTVSKEMTGPIAEEFAILQKEINLGLATESALENLVVRVSSDDLELVVTAVLIQRQVGGNLSEVLDNISSTIRDRIKMKGEVRAITAQGRMSGLILSLLPPALGFILFLINPDHISVLFKEPMGIAIIAFSLMMELIGIFFINKIVKVKI